ncbi:ral guanine nucleotide dissociation stimulator-like [Microtus pennsylvanicus]|uniref:ral guanine nucleotide dissociation stimulator-like n=1 Tax=Microtus pennsylvanicus TaxID=10058 RepID=UPI003F6ACBAB
MGSDTGDTMRSAPQDQDQPESIPGDPVDPAPGDLTESFPGDPVDSAPQDQLEDQKDSVPGDPKILDFGDLEEVVEDLITSLQNGDREHLIAFLSTYPAHTTIEQVLDVIFRRYACFRPGCQEDEQLKNTICTLLDTWTSVFPGDFATTPGMSALKKVKTYLIIHLPYSDVLIRVHELLMRLLSETSEESD